MAAPQNSCQLACTSEAAELGGAGPVETIPGRCVSDIPPLTCQHYLGTPLQAAAPVFAPPSSSSRLPLSSFLKEEVVRLQELQMGLPTCDIPHLFRGGGTEPGRASPGRAVAQVVAGACGAKVGAKVNRGRTVAQCTAHFGANLGGPESMFAKNADSLLRGSFGEGSKTGAGEATAT